MPAAPAGLAALPSSRARLPVPCASAAGWVGMPAASRCMWAARSRCLRAGAECTNPLARRWGLVAASASELDSRPRLATVSALQRRPAVSLSAPP